MNEEDFALEQKELSNATHFKTKNAIQLGRYQRCCRSQTKI